MPDSAIDMECFINEKTENKMSIAQAVTIEPVRLFQDISSLIFIAPAYSRVRYRSPNFCPSVRSFVRPFVRPSTFTSKFGFLDINDSCESQTLHSYCP